MSNIIFSTVFILLFIKTVRDGLFYIWLWQIKEYRIDRMTSHLKDKGNAAAFAKTVLYLFLTLLLFYFYFNWKEKLFTFLSSIFIIFETIKVFLEVKKRTIKRPKFTFKAILIFLSLFFSLLSLSAIFLLNNIVSTSALLFLYILFCVSTPVIVSLIVLSVNPIFERQKKKIIKKASLKMKSLKNIKVIGITGSYGKTSTKEFLYAILNQKYKTVKTKKNNNTNIGVAKTILNEVSENCECFVYEAGAYKIGEIAEICEMAKPQISILTGINEQHIDLFGSIEKIKKAKFEIIESLPKDGLAIINKDLEKETLKEKSRKKIKAKNIIYFSEKPISNIKIYQEYIIFDYKNVSFKVNIIGRHYIKNLIAAIIAAERLKMKLPEIKEAVLKIKPTEFMIKKISIKNNCIFLDDSYNANSNGVLAAVDYLCEKEYEDYKRIIVFSPIIELGSKSKAIHNKIFKKIDNVFDNAYITQKKNPYNGSKCGFVFENDFDKIAFAIISKLKNKTVILFEGRGARVVIKKTLNRIKQNYV